MSKYAKAIVGTVGAVATAALGIFPPHTLAWNIATLAAAAATGVSVYVVPNGTRVG